MKDKNKPGKGKQGTKGKETMEKLGGGEAKYRELAESITDVFFAFDKDLKYTYWNKASEKLTGISAKDVIGKSIYDIFPDTDWRRRAVELYQGVLRTKQPQSLINETQLDGKDYFFEISAYPAGDGLSTFVKDITEGKKAEEALQGSEERYRSLVETASAGIASVDMEGKLLFINDRLCQMLGFSKETILGKPFVDFLHPDDVPGLTELFLSAVAGDRTNPMLEFRLIDKDGQNFWIFTNPAPIARGGETVGFNAILQDITGRKRAEEKIVRQTAVLEAVNLMFQETLRCETDEEVARFCLAVAQELTGSKFGWVGEVNALGNLDTIVLSDPGWESCRMPQTKAVRMIRNMEVRGIWGRVLKDEKSLISNDPATHPDSVGLPKGHPELTAFLGVPLKHAGRTIGMIALANKPSGYEVQDKEAIEALSVALVEALNRKRAEEALRQSEERYRTIIEDMDEGYFELDLVGNFTVTNDANCRNLGYTREELLGMNYSRVVSEEDPEAVRQGLKHMFKTGQPGLGLHRKILRKDGSIRFAEVSMFPMRGNDGKIIGFRGIGWNITERKRAEEALRQSEERYRLLVENANEAIIVAQDGILKFANVRTEELTGYEKEELTSMPFLQLIYPDDGDMVVERHLKRLKGEVLPAVYPFRFVRKDGSVGWVEINAVLITWEGRPATLNFLTDITERQRAEEALRQSEERFRKIFEEGPFGIVVTSRDRRFFSANPAFCQMLGYTAEEMSSRTFLDVTHPEHRAADRENVDKMWRDENPHYMTEKRYIAKNGDIRWGSVSTSLIRGQDGQPLYALAMVKDITERKKAEEERRQLELKAQVSSRLASVGELAAGVAHEINNPLTAVTGYAQLLLERDDITPGMRKDLVAINDGAMRVAGIVQRLLAFSRQTKPGRKLLNISQLVESTLVLRDYHLKANNIKVTTKLAPDLPQTVADPGQIQQVMLNLIVNAEKEMKLAHGKGKLTISTEKSDGTIKISVKDDGPGIKPEVLERIFDPFFTTREVGEGTGLGLSLCYGIVAEHNGRIYAENNTGKGATFVVELPIVAEAETLESPEPVVEQPEKVGKAKILVVDDEQVIRDLAKRILGGEGHQVDTVDNAADALEKIKTKRYNLILLDVKMPGMSGPELYRRIEKRASSLAKRVVFVTGDVMGADTEKFLTETKVAHIAKPFDAGQLKREVRRALNEVRFRSYTD
jgi:PAS domain S-box-containing protein